jgi:CMP-N-acetylneuraminic acid synthetase/spore coat polysaccharide biosynthesis predicted glycosyltransferase SpsG
MRSLFIIPARGGSKGIPRKNLRILGGFPLVTHSINACLGVTIKRDVVVTTDDPEIAYLSKRLGADVIERPPSLAQDHITLDPVVYHAYSEMLRITGNVYDYVITVQPTSPFITSETLSSAIQQLSISAADTLISVIDDTHLTWTRDRSTGAVKPNYERRINRQWLPQILKETGSVLACRSSIISETSRIGDKVELMIVDEKQGIDIDTPLQWTFCDSISKRRKWLFLVTGDSTTGSGHAYRAKTLADWLASEDVSFLCLPGSTLAAHILGQSNYITTISEHDSLLNEIRSASPDIIVLDILDTDRAFVKNLKQIAPCVVTFEDFGCGADEADLVINALYQDPDDRRNHVFYGPDYFCFRNEFLYTAKHCPKASVDRVLLTFGGTDPANLTLRIANCIANICESLSIQCQIVIGPGYQHSEHLFAWAANRPHIAIASSVGVMSDYIANADLCFTSCGRTVYEIASIGVPMICLAQNDRETLHTFARPENGIIYLGPHWEVTDDAIIESFRSLQSNIFFRQMICEIMNAKIRSRGCQHVIDMIKQVSLEQEAAKV